MGVPFFFKWIRGQCRKAVTTVIEPGSRCDNLYIDLNGILHTFFTTDSADWRVNFEETMQNAALYILKIVDLCGPTSLLLLALDGVPPKAKLNQQRSRRFLSAFEKRVVHGMHSNMITPGTEFMAEAGAYLHKFIESQAPGWRNLRVIFSDTNQPGEGEHKIFDYIRQLRAEPGYDPNLRHLIYGPDADLIVLGLCIHEPNLTILREDPTRQPKIPYAKGRVIFISGFGEKTETEDRQLVQTLCAGFKALQVHVARNRPSGLAYVEFEESDTSGEVLLRLRGVVARGRLIRSGVATRLPSDFRFMQSDRPASTIDAAAFLLVSIAHIRVYLHQSFKQLEGLMDYDFERLVDDMVLLSVLVGNDFLPALPGLAIEEGALDLLIGLYVRHRPTLGGYFTDCGVIDFPTVHAFLGVLASLEAKLLQRHTFIRQWASIRTMTKDQRKKYYDRLRAQKYEILSGLSESSTEEDEANHEQDEEEMDAGQDTLLLEEQEDIGDKVSFVDFETDIDYAKPGYSERYYHSLFPSAAPELSGELCSSYWTGVQWILKYYSQGPPSWEWSFDLLFPPLCSTLASAPVPTAMVFPPTEPVSPFEQLLHVLPPQHEFFLPPCLHGVLEGELQQPTPTTLVLNMTGKTVPWQGVPVISFLDIAAVRTAAHRRFKQFTQEEVARNAVRLARCYSPAGVDAVALAPETSQIKFGVLPGAVFVADLPPTPFEDYRNLRDSSFVRDSFRNRRNGEARRGSRSTSRGRQQSGRVLGQSAVDSISGLTATSSGSEQALPPLFVDSTAPTAKIKCKLLDSKAVVVTVNHSHTTQDLYQEISRLAARR